VIGSQGLHLRLGAGLVVLSWLPIAQTYIWVADLDDEAADRARLVIWSVQVLVGLIGLLVAGAAAKSVVRGVGWRRLPGALWSMLRTGEVGSGLEPASGPGAIP